MSCQKASLSATLNGDWVQSAPLPYYPRGYGSSFVIGDTAYVGLGWNEKIGGKFRLKDMWAFNLDSGWTQKADFPGVARSNAAAFSIGNYGFIGTGTDDGQEGLNDFYQYDAGKDEWAIKAEYPGAARYDAVGFAVQGKGYIGTGMGAYWLNDFYEYDTLTGAWARTKGTTGNFAKRTAAAAFVYKDKAYIVTGAMSGAMAKDFWSFDPSQGEPWERLADIANSALTTADDGYAAIQRQHATVFVNSGKAYLTLGDNGTQLTTTWMYDFDAKQWYQRSAYPRAPRIGAVAFTIKGRSFIGTGATGSNSTFDDFNEFVPDTPFNPNH